MSNATEPGSVMFSPIAGVVETDATRNPIRVLVVDDHEVVREGVSAALAADEELRWSGPFRLRQRPSS